MICSYQDCTKAVVYIKKQMCKQHYSLEYRTKNLETTNRAVRHYMAKNAKNPLTQEFVTEEVKQRFFDKVDKTDTCWNWTAARTSYRPQRAIAPATVGYGSFLFNKRPVGAHRVSWLIHNGPLIPGLVIDHLCDNTLCVNPDHLQQVTTSENTLRSPKHSANGAKYAFYKTHCKYGHVRPEEARSKQCPECYAGKLKKKR